MVDSSSNFVFGYVMQRFYVLEVSLNEVKKDINQTPG